MARTPEQVEADNVLTAAIEQAMRAHFDDGDDPGLLMDYTVIAARGGIDDDGDRWSSTVTLTRDNNVPSHIQIGLLDTRLSFLRATLRPADDD
ncbi:hypothetical protein ACFRAQ_35835 [Nocardia sp. NPDC056611]|uniref:hypothetical protein n=1 Tax=Nocardia sp. NPDC056611 TaxID=3345877 RepID=UPI00366FE431